VVEAFPEQAMISVNDTKNCQSPKEFTFDAVFGPESNQKDIYDSCIASAVDSVLKGYNATVFAYGQVTQFTSLWSGFMSLFLDWIRKNPHHGRKIRFLSDQRHYS
jgi:hypothetical protein